MDKKIQVVNIISQYKVVLNCGSNENIKAGETFIIYTLGEVIKDPETQEELERLEIVRGKGEVVHVQNKICTVESIEFEPSPTIIRKRSQDVFSSFLSPQVEEVERKSERIPFKDVQIGDLGRKCRNS